MCVDMLFYDNYNCIHIFTNYTVIVTNVQSTGESKSPEERLPQSTAWRGSFDSMLGFYRIMAYNRQVPR